MPDAHSLLVGGSIADRRIHCPASFQESLRAPPGVASVYADEGTSLHEAITELLKNPKAKVIGKEFYGNVITQELYDNMLDPALAALEELEDKYGGNFEIIGLDLRVSLDIIVGAFGTIDIL